MRRGLGALFVAFLAVRVMTAPASAPSQPAASPEQGKTSKLRTPGRGRATTQQDQASALPAACNSKSQQCTNVCESKSAKCPEKGLLEALENPFGSAEVDADFIEQIQKLAKGGREAHFLIATVPDPVHTHLSLFFDRQIVAIEEAVQQGGYLFSEAYLPWDNLQHPEDTDFRLRLQEEDYKDDREKYPGVLAFHYRESLGDPMIDPLLVFLVAETPTGGINPDQFNNAIAAIGAICLADCADPQPVGKRGHLFILGPTFSGSFHSLREALSRLPVGLSEAVIHSGTATDKDTIDWFTTKPFISPFPFWVTFRTFEEGTDYALQHLLTFVCREGYRANQVAVLSEDETA